MSKKLTTIILILLIMSCEKDPALFKIENLNNNEVTILGHRGMGELYKYPGNSWEAIEPVLRIGADGTEIDVQITRDSVLVLYHDEFLQSQTNRTGLIYDHLLSDLGNCTYNSPLSKFIYLISADNLFSRLPNVQEYTFSFDCKLHPGTEGDSTYYRQYAKAIKDILDKYDMHGNVLIESSDTVFHNIVRDEGVSARHFITGLTSVAQGIPIAEEQGYYGIGTGNPSATKEDIDHAHEKGLRVMLWGAKTHQGNLEVIQKNPDFVQTDKPIHLLKVFDRYLGTDGEGD